MSALHTRYCYYYRARAGETRAPPPAGGFYLSLRDVRRAAGPHSRVATLWAAALAPFCQSRAAWRAGFKRRAVHSAPRNRRRGRSSGASAILATLAIALF